MAALGKLTRLSERSDGSPQSCRMWIENYLSALVRRAAAAGDRRRDCAGLAPEVRAHSDGRIEWARKKEAAARHC